MNRMVEDTSRHVLLESKIDGKPNTTDEIQLIKKRPLSRSTSKEDSDENSNDSSKKLKRHSDVTLGAENKKLKIDIGEIPDLNEEVFEWPTYLSNTGALTVKNSFFKHIVPECMCGFEPGMKLEVPNRDYKNTYWLATIIAKASPLILVRYEGFKETNNADFWCNTLTDDIHPVGWCARSKHALKPPKAIQNQEKNWYAYLIKNLTGARKASENLFLKKSHPVHYLRAGHYVEVIDQYNPTCYWLARIIEVYSGRLNLQYEGYEEKHSDFWCYYLSENLRPVGYGLKNALTLYPPKSTESISHAHFRKITEKVIALSRRSDNTVFKTLFQGWVTKKEHNLRLGMKLEAINPENYSEICVASVTRIFDHFYFLVKIDNLITVQDNTTDSFVAHKGSLGIFPIGFCLQSGLHLEQPKGYNGKFTWENYLKYTKTEAVPESFFTEAVCPEDISVGMKLEAVDKENPANICVCTVTKLVGGHIWLRIDGDTRKEQIFPCNTYDMFPVGWCESTGHELQWPRPETLQQKNRISSLRHTATRKNRLEDLRKGKVTTSEPKETKKDVTPTKQKRNTSKTVIKGRRGVSRKRRIFNDDDKEGTVDTTIAFVCINRLAEEFNTEESIKKFYRLDAENRVPAEIVTIDDDDSEDDDTDIQNGNRKSEPRFTEDDLNYLSFLRVKPKELSKSENELYEKKMSEHESHKAIDDDTTSSSHLGRKGRSLSSVVAMLTANKNPIRPHLLEQYKQNKNKSKGNNEVIDLSGDDPVKTALTNAIQPAPDGSINIPGKGQFKIMEQIVTKQGDKNKIILRLGKSKPGPSQNAAVGGSGRSQTAGGNLISQALNTVVDSLSRSTAQQQPYTHINDIYTIGNMARSHKGLDEMLRNRFNKVHGFCKNLPRNPLLWDRNHVSLFIINADFEKYATNFYEQEIDGHSLLLLTAQEIHHILGIRLGPAMKIHDLIYSLQQIVNEAYLANEMSDEGSTLPNNKTNDDVIKTTVGIIADETSTKENEDGVDPLLTPPLATSEKQPNNDTKTESTKNNENGPVVFVLQNNGEGNAQSQKIAKVEQTDNILIEMEETSQPVDRDDKQDIATTSNIESEAKPESTDVEASNEKVAKWIDSHNEALEKIRMETVGDFEKEYYGLLNANYPPGINPFMMNPFRPKAPKHPVRFIQIQPVSSANGAPQPGMMYPPPGVQFVRMPQPVSPTSGNPQQMPYIVQFGSVKDAKAKQNGSAAAANKKEKNSSPTRHYTKSGAAERRKRKSNGIQSDPRFIKVPTLENAIHIMPKLPSNAQEIFNKYLKDIKVELHNKELWDDFYKTGTEMILTRNGRRMFPSLQTKMTGLTASAKYIVILDFIPVDQCRYKFEYESSKWMVACEEGTPMPAQTYMHPFSPQYGFEWCRSEISFLKCKLTNNLREAGGHVLMQSMHKYQPRINILYWDGSLPLQITHHEMLRLCVKREILFEETKFIAVTAYQNNQVTHLKIQSNPFARGFRGDWRKTKGKRNKNKNNTSLEDEEMYTEMHSDEDEDSSDHHNGGDSFENKENDTQFRDTIIKVEPSFT